MVKRWGLRDELKSFAVIGWWGGSASRRRAGLAIPNTLGWASG